MIEYPFLYLYAFIIGPLMDARARYKNHREYQVIIEQNYHERSLLLHELIQSRADIERYKTLYGLGMPYEEHHHTIVQGVCRIIYRQLDQKDSFFIIDKGSYHGIAVDMVAVVNGVLIGKVAAVYPWYSHIMPLSNLACYVPVICSQSRAHGMFHGNKLDFVSHLEPLCIGELVLTSGDGLLYPEGLAVGRIKTFAVNDLGFLYDVDIEPLIDIIVVPYCSIVSKNTQQALGGLV